MPPVLSVQPVAYPPRHKHAKPLKLLQFAPINLPTSFLLKHGYSITMNPTGYISRLFGRSPVRPLQQHFEKAAACAHELPALCRPCRTGTGKKQQKSVSASSSLNTRPMISSVSSGSTCRAACSCRWRAPTYLKCCRSRIALPTRPVTFQG